jgi:hypothetical protein
MENLQELSFKKIYSYTIHVAYINMMEYTLIGKHGNGKRK